MKRRKYKRLAIEHVRRMKRIARYEECYMHPKWNGASFCLFCGGYEAGQQVYHRDNCNWPKAQAWKASQLALL